MRMDEKRNFEPPGSDVMKRVSEQVMSLNTYRKLSSAVIKSIKKNVMKYYNEKSVSICVSRCLPLRAS